MAVDDQVRTRRAVLLGSLGAAGAFLANSLGRAVPVNAANGDTMKVGTGHVATARTSIEMYNTNNGDSVFHANSTGASRALYGQSQSGTAVMGASNTGDAMYAHSISGYGLKVESVHNYGIAAQSDENYAVYGTSVTSYALVGLSDSSIGVVGMSSTGGGVFGQAGSTAPGVEGRSSEGRGGLFGGKAAQVRLVPSAAASHPSSGAAGDIFLDKSKRLWLCKGGTNWVRLDT